MKNFILRYRFPVVLALSLLCVAAVIGLTRYYFVLKERELRAKIDAETHSIPVVVAQRDLSAGTKLDSSTVSLRQIPSAYVPEGAILPNTFGKYEGMVLSESLSGGKPLLRHYIKGIAHAEKFSDLLKPGERAITLQVDGVNSVEHMIESGDFIDLAVKYKKGEGFELLLERVLVLSTGNITTADPKAPGMYKNADYSTLTIGVDDSYVQKVFEAHSKGELAFLLRNEKDELASRYSSLKNGSAVAVYAGKKAEGGVLSEVKEIKKSVTANDLEVPERNEKGRIIRKSPSDIAEKLITESKDAKDVAVNHE